MAATHVVLSNSASGTTPAKYKQRFVLNQATAATGGATFVMPYAGTITGVYASALCTQSSDRTDTITVTKRAQNAATAADTAVLTTSGVISSNNVAGTITRVIGSSGITAFTGNTNPVLSTTAATLAVAKGDTLYILNTTAGANGSAATQLCAEVEVEFDLGETTSYSLS